MFGYIITRELTDEERAQLVQKLDRLGAEYAPIPREQGGGLPPFIPGNPGALDGWETRGSVAMLWVRGVPIEAHKTDDLADRAEMPGRHWGAMVAAFGPEVAINMAYITFLESRWNESVPRYDDIERSYGEYQINANAWPQYTPVTMPDIESQAAAARVIFDAQGYGAWLNAATDLGLI